MVIGVATLLLLIVFVYTSKMIGDHVKTYCMKAQEKYQQDCTLSLIELLDDSQNSFHDRNMAIWALGQLGQKEALPVLEKYYTGKIPDKEPLDEVISQYELKKAINLARGGLNITHYVWKR